MNDELIVVRIRGERAVGGTRYGSDGVQDIPCTSHHALGHLCHVTAAYPNAYVAWFDVAIADFIRDIQTWPTLLQHPLEILHLSCFQRCDLMVNELGFVDFDSPFLIPGPTDRRFPTWLISPMCGVTHARVFEKMGLDANAPSLAAALFGFGRRTLQYGVCCYSEPRLLKSEIPVPVLDKLRQCLTSVELLYVITVGYGRKWIWFWVAAIAICRHRFPLISFFRHLFSYPAVRGIDTELAKELHLCVDKSIDVRDEWVDVVIPTLNRPQHVRNVLRDLAAQTVIPKKVIVVEQIPVDAESLKPLDEIQSATWPFAVRHIRVQWIGACRARNVGFREIEHDWVLLLDDDIRLPSRFVEHLLELTQCYKIQAANGSVYLPHQVPTEIADKSHPVVWSTFGSGVGLVAAEIVREIGGFDEKLEGGWGEDYEFGIRIRLAGSNILFTRREPVLHLKAPSGGFRFRIDHPWSKGEVQPRPSPTVLYSRMKHLSETQMSGYKLYYWLNHVRGVSRRQRFRELWRVRRDWNSAERWSKMLGQLPQHEI